MSLYFDVIDADQALGSPDLGRQDLGRQDLGRQDLGRQGEDGRVRLIREILPFVIAKYGISPECLHAERSPEPIPAVPNFLPGHHLEHILTAENS